MSDPVQIVREVARRWNEGNVDAIFELFHDDLVVQPGEHWPDPAVLEGKQAFRESTDEWLNVWESVLIETDEVEAHGERVVVHGAWRSTGRFSGIEGTMPIHIVFTVRDGKIARLEWYPDHERAVAAARHA